MLFDLVEDVAPDLFAPQADVQLVRAAVIVVVEATELEQAFGPKAPFRRRQQTFDDALVRGGDAPGGGTGRFAKKAVTLTVCEVVDVSGRNPTDVGSLVLNLAEYASMDGTEHELKLPLATAAIISAAVGSPVLHLTIRRAGGRACAARVLRLCALGLRRDAAAGAARADALPAPAA